MLDLNDNQLKWVTNHLGHSLDVHNVHYRCTSDELERTRIAKILLLQDHSKVTEFANKKLEDIQFDGMFISHRQWWYVTRSIYFVTVMKYFFL